MRTNLNELQIQTDMEPVRLQDHGICTPSVDVHFRDLASRLIALINEADYVVGCVAWLTHYGILDALAKKSGVSLVVQKEDWLRPDGDVSKQVLRAKYEALPWMERFQHQGLVSKLSSSGDPSLAAVRCAGIRAAKGKFEPRCHHKFVVFCRKDQWGDVGETYAVWTGSFNFTFNGGDSLENAVVIRTPEIVRAYYNEYQQIVALSEPLDWEHEWVAPEWRIGT